MKMRPLFFSKLYIFYSRYSWFPSTAGGIHGFGTAPRDRQRDNDSRRTNWGRGRVLGE